MQADEGDRVALDVVGVGQEVGHRDGGVAPEPDLVDPVVVPRRVVDRGDRDLDPGGRRGAGGVAERVDEARRPEIIGPQPQLQVLAVDPAGGVGGREGELRFLVAIDLGAGPVGQRVDADDVQALELAVDIAVVGQQRGDPGPQVSGPRSPGPSDRRGRSARRSRARGRPRPGRSTRGRTRRAPCRRRRRRR